jgi:hypothetical protein
MAEEKEKAIEKEQPPQHKAPEVEDEFSEQDLKKEQPMPEEKEKTIEKGQPPQPEAAEVEDELPEADLEKVAGGADFSTSRQTYVREDPCC